MSGFLSFFLFAFVVCCTAADKSTVPSAVYPIWAHYHMVWLSSGHNQTECTDLVKDYLAHNISVGGTNIDSAWSTGFNNFEWNSNFPDAKAMVSGFKNLGVRTIVWATSMIDTDSSNFELAKSSGYLVSQGETVHWWHGNGGFLDFTYDAAMTYWKGLLDKVLVDTGIDGFKCDGTDPYILELDLTGGAKGHNGNRISYREYADLYYGTFFNHSRARNPNAIIWSRPVDSWNNYVYWDFSPRYVSFSGWVGDQNPNFGGLVDAMNNLLHSAWANYVSFGSDTGGYRSGGEHGLGRTRDELLRWAQLNSLMGLFENGGDNEHRPWMFPEPEITTAIYKYFVDLHHSLSSYLLTSGSNAYDAGTSLIRPVAKKPLLPFSKPSTYDYFLGPSIFVSPIVQPNVTTTLVKFPKGQDYVDWNNNTLVYKGGTSISFSAPVTSTRYPVFHVQGNLLVRNFFPKTNADLYLKPEDETLEIFLPVPRLGDKHSISVRHYLQLSHDISYHYVSKQKLVLYFSAHPRNVVLRITGVDKPSLVTDVNGKKMEWTNNDALEIVVPSKNIGNTVTVYFH